MPMPLRKFNIPLPDAAAEQAARRRQERLTKPPGSLGTLEEVACRLAGIQGTAAPQTSRKFVVIAAADHGVAAEGVSPYPQAVTRQMTLNFIAGGAAISVLARAAGCEVIVVDAGVAGPPLDEGRSVRRVGRGPSGNIALGPAMSRDQAESLLMAGAQIASELAGRGAHIVATGDMGIGNTTVAAALTAVFTGLPPAEVTGRGTGLDEAGVARKAAVVERALAVNRPSAGDGVGALAAVGGPEVAVLAGLVLGAAERRCAIALDGFVSTAAALVAAAIEPISVRYLFACHLSAEKGHAPALRRLGLKPMLDLGMRLGEGTGAALGMMLIDSAVRLHNEMATFESAGVAGRQG
jgi:nicotinate-nucleotide--dimethylbenzimidazole phosphoribosyltransferase